MKIHNSTVIEMILAPAFGIVALACDYYPANAAAIPNFWKCENRLNGSMEYGRVPWGCDSSVFGPDSYVQDLYGSLIIEDAGYGDQELTGYMTALVAAVRDVSAYYLSTRESNVSTEEAAAWQRAIYAVMSHESMWSHYRLGSDGRLKITRGDSAHGFGLMQIDDRYHTTEINSGQAWDLVGNAVLGMNIYYLAWQKAATAKCVGGPTHWENRARAAYSYYNSGTNLCRWTDAKSKWADSDNDFRENFEKTPWAKYVSDPNFASPVEAECAVENPNTEKSECKAQTE